MVGPCYRRAASAPVIFEYPVALSNASPDVRQHIPTTPTAIALGIPLLPQGRVRVDAQENFLCCVDLLPDALVARRQRGPF